MPRRARASLWRALSLALATTFLIAAVPPVLGAQDSTAALGLHVELDAAREPYRSRVELAARESWARYQEWLGKGPAPSLTISDRPLGAAQLRQLDVELDLPRWSPRQLMDVESQVAYGVALLWFRHAHETDGAVPLVDSVAWYLQSRVVERLFDHAYRPEHSDEAVRYFGGALPWVFEALPLSRWSAGLGRGEFLRGIGRGRAWPASARRLPPAFDPRAVQGALAFGTLERHVGWPTLQAALRAVAQRAADGPMDRSAFFRTVSAAAGQDLSWFLEPAFDPAIRYAYAVTAFSTEPRGDSCGVNPCYRTRVTVARRGEGRFTGTARTPIGVEEAGDAIELRVTYQDHQSISARWDGRAASKVFEFDSPAPAVTAELDPDRVLLLDVNPLEHSRSLASRTNVSIGKWTARWVMWLQDAMLTYGFLLG